MPTDKRGEQGHNRQNGGMREMAWQAGQQVRKGTEAVSDRVQEGFESAREGVTRGYRRVEGTIARNPAPSLLISFGFGFGLGFVLCQMFARDEDTWAERHITGPIRHFPENVREGVRYGSGQAHHLAEAIASHLPDAIKRRMG